MKNPKLLILAHLPPPFHGASFANQNLINSTLIQERFTLEVIDIKTAKTIDDIGSFRPGKVFASIALLFKIIYKVLSFNPEIIYFTPAPSGFAFYRDAVIVWLIKFSRKKTILHLHGKGFRPGEQKSKLFGFFAKRLFNGTYTIHLSAKLLDDVVQSGIRRQFIVPYGIPVTANIRNQPANEIVRILYLANYVKTKGVLVLLNAVALLAHKRNDFHLEVVGKDFDITAAQLNEKVKSAGLEKYVTISGPKYNEEKHDALSKAHIFALPTFYYNEAFPISLLEAMQYELAIVTTKEGGIADMLTDEKTAVFADKENITDTADKLSWLLDNKERLFQMGKHAREEFLDKYTVAHFEQNLANVFQEVLTL